MQNNTLGLAAAVLVIGLFGGYVIGHSYASSTSSEMVTSQKQEALNKAMRTLWDDHVAYTRMYIVDSVAGNAGAGATTARLMQNQVDIGNAIKPFYGEAAGAQLTALLKAHIEDAVVILTAAKAGDQAKLAAGQKAWYDNANEIAAFLNKANPNSWTLEHMQAHMKDHLDLTLDEAVMQLKGNYAVSIQDYDKAHSAILDLADTLSAGIVAQFPDKF